jgi:hypothetical protein
MGEPNQGMAADLAVAFGDVRPVSVLFKAEEYAERALVGASDQLHFIAFAKLMDNRFSVRHLCFILWCVRLLCGRLWAEFWLVHEPRLFELDSG